MIYPLIKFFIHPVPFFCIFVMALNDHLFKYYFHNWFTGKLSDFLGVFFFPLFLSAILSVALQSPLNRTRLFFSILFTGLLFVGIKINFHINRKFEEMLFSLNFPSHFVMDTQDLVALLSCYFTWHWGTRFIK